MRRGVVLLALLLGCRPAATPDSPPAAAPMVKAPAPAPAPSPTPALASGDRDLDGVPDTQDRCPDEPEDRDQFEDSDGCVDRDNDLDGILDAHEFRDGRWTNCDHRRENGVDSDCRTIPEDFDGVQDHDGCPDVLSLDCGGPLRLADRVHLDRHGHFTGDAAKVLDEVAATLLAAPNIELWVEAHIDKQRSPTLAKPLTQRVAQEVVEALVARGVARERLEPIGWGDIKPIDYRNPTAGRAQNRRVEFSFRNGCNHIPGSPNPDGTQPHECR